MKVQSILFPISKWYPKKIHNWLYDYNYKLIKRLHKTENYYRARIKIPKKNDRYITHSLSNGVKLVIAI